MSDYYNASGVPAFKASLASSTIRAEFIAVKTGISDKLPTLSGMGDRIVKVNAGGTALESVASLGIAQGGTGAATAAAARTALGVAIGTNVQAHSARLAEIAALTPTDSNVMVGNGTAWVAETGATLRTSLGLGTGNSPTFAGLTLTTPLAVAQGGTGASTASAARTALGLGTLATLSTISNSQWSGTDLAVANGGTGSSTASGARGNLGAAAASHNHSASDITTGTLAVARGGTGQTTMDNLSEQVVLQWTIQSDPGGTPSGSPGDVFAYY